MDAAVDYDTIHVTRRPTPGHLRIRRPGSSVVTTVPRSDDVIDLQGVRVNECWIDDLDQYTVLVDDDTWIGDLYTGARPRPLTDTQQDFVDRIYDRPRFPMDRRDGCVFTYDDLKRDFVMSHHHPVFMNLVQNGAIQRLDETYYAVLTGYCDAT